MKEILEKYCKQISNNSYQLELNEILDFDILSNDNVLWFINSCFIKEFTLPEKLEMFFKSLE